MASYKVDVAVRRGSDVGEGPYWDAVAERLLWTDITAGEIHAFSPSTGVDEVIIQRDEPTGAVVRMTSGELALTLRGTIVAVDETSGGQRLLADVEPNEAFRFNDAAVDPQGRLVAGTMAYQPQAGTAGLYRLEFDGTVTTLIEGVGLSNGMCWSADGRTMYFVESLSREVRVFDYDETLNPLSVPRSVIRIPEGVGTPDGLTIDSDGNLWLALWGGSAVWHMTPSGDVVDTIEFPVAQVTSAAFAGVGSHRLFVTSAAYNLDPQSLEQQPLAGSLFVVDVHATGVSERVMNAI